MKIYLDSVDSFYSINHEQGETKPKKKYSKNDEKIGVISLILIMAFVAYLIWTIFDDYAFGVPDNDICTGDEGTLCNSNATAQLSSQETWNSSSPIHRLNVEEQRQLEKFLEMGEAAYKKECYKSLGISNEFAEDLLDYMPDDLSKDVCDARIKEFKNLTTTGTGESGANQSSALLGRSTYETYSDNTDGFSLEYPTDWHISDSNKGLNVYKGTRGFTVDIYDDPQFSLIDTYDFGRIMFEHYDEDSKYKITDQLAELNIDDEPALSFSYSYGNKEVMATAVIHNNDGYLFKYETLKESSDSDIDTMTRFLGTIRFTS